MLDQNTDRMWYVIGAVLVGAAIILIANGTMPQLFASVTESFQNVTEEAMTGVKGVTAPGKNWLLNSSSPRTSNGYIDYRIDLDTFNELQGETVTISFDVKAEEDDHHWVDVYFRSLDGTNVGFEKSKVVEANGEYIRHARTLIVPDLTMYQEWPLAIRFRGNRWAGDAEDVDTYEWVNDDWHNGNAGAYSVRNVKMELGHTDTGYIPHEDEE